MAKLDSLTPVNESKKSVAKSLFTGNSVKKIRKDTSTVKELNKNLDKQIDLIKKITNPTAEWIVKKIEGVSGISDIEIVSETTDYDKLLNKEDGGYTGCIYFIVDKIENKLFGDLDSSLNRGTDGGGAIEIYDTIEDAINRCDYLSQFDGTILYTGSYVLIGTMVIRTSYVLSDEEQYELTDNLVKAITDMTNH